jgi:DeoR/GlpR family transcriptional regulator of sugar metabolism
MTQQFGRTYRNEVHLKIRKDKNHEKLKKKRMEHTNMAELNSSVLQHHLQQFGDGQSFSVEDQINIIEKIRQMLSHNESLIEEAIGGNYLNYLITNLKNIESVDLIHESLWALANLASTQYTQQVITAGAIDPVISVLLSSTNQEIISQAAWFLGNCASDCEELQNYLLQKGILHSM